MSTRQRGIVAVDTHAHVFHRRLALAGGRRYTPDYDATIADYLAMLDRTGSSHGVLVQPSFLGTDNSYLLSALQTAPARLRGIAVVAPEIGRAALSALDAAGCVGVRLNLIGRKDPALDSPLWQRHFEDLAALGWQLEVQAEAGRWPTLLRPLIATGLPIVIDHFGRPDPSLGVDDPGFRALLDAAGVTVKLSGAYRNGRPGLALEAAAMLRDALGPERLFWGSDWPHTQFETAVTPEETRIALERWLPDPAERRAVLVDTPARLFRFQSEPSSSP